MCRIELTRGDPMRVACLVGQMNELPSTPLSPTQLRRSWFVEHAEDTKMRLVRAGERVGFIFIYDVSQYPDARFTARFTDDAGLHWQIDEDLHLEKLANRDDW
jgi:hypothetical protein